MDIPQDLTTLNQEQEQYCINQLKTYTLHELRIRQDLCKSQKKLAFDSNNTAALNNLDVMERHLFTAIWKLTE